MLSHAWGASLKIIQMSQPVHTVLCKRGRPSQYLPLTCPIAPMQMSSAWSQWVSGFLLKLLQGNLHTSLPIIWFQMTRCSFWYYPGGKRHMCTKCGASCIAILHDIRYIIRIWMDSKYHGLQGIKCQNNACVHRCRILLAIATRQPCSILHLTSASVGLIVNMFQCCMLLLNQNS